METYLQDELDQYMAKDKAKILSSHSLLKPIEELHLPLATLISPKTTVADAISIMQTKKFGALLVEEKERLVGIITERDILMKVVGKSWNLQKTVVEIIMTPQPEFLQMNDPMIFAMNLMDVGGYRHVPIVDANQKPISILSMRDIVGYLTEFFENDVINLPPTPIRENQAREGA